MNAPFATLSLGHYYLQGGLLYRKVDDHLVKRVVDSRTEAAPRGHEPVEPVTIGCRKEAWPIPVDEQEWLAWRVLDAGIAAVRLQPVGVGATEHQAIAAFAAELESDLQGEHHAVR